MRIRNNKDTVTKACIVLSIFSLAKSLQFNFANQHNLQISFIPLDECLIIFFVNQLV